MKKINAFCSKIYKQILYCAAAGFIIFYLEGCSCETYCAWWSGGLKVAGKVHVGTDTSGHRQELNPLPEKDECDICHPLPPGTSSQSSVTQETDPGAVINPAIPQKKAPEQIGDPSSFPGEYFSTTFFAGPTLSFKSSAEAYSYQSSKHDPGAGFQAGIGVAFPLSNSWGIAPSIRYKQMTASETLSYSMPGAESSEYKDTYKYNYAGATILAEYRPAKHLAIVAGPELNYLLSANMKGSGSSGSGEKTTLTKDSNKMGVDILAGIKYEIPAGNARSKWGLSLMYDHRLSRLNKTKVDGYEVPAYKMKGVQLGISYFLCKCGGKKTR